MDTNDPMASPSAGMPSSTMGVFGTRLPSAITFAVGGLLLLLPFFEINFANVFALQNSVAGIAAGHNWRLAEKGLIGDLVGGQGDFSQINKNEPNIYAIIALALGSAAFILSLLTSRQAQRVAMVLGIFTAAMLIGLWIDLRKTINLPATNSNEGNIFRISFQPTPWFYVAVIAFLAGAFFCYKRIQLSGATK